WIYAALILASRVIIQAHFVSDVLAAAFVGGFGAILVRNWFAARGLAFFPARDGTMRAMPGPSWRRVKMVARRLLGQ
ncbi:MAG TPA: phosphatase PAP2 family protein, partial [Xanthobacteraceae bacterium]|nr:phosphatase PAP2 family protein [Xanthobacteraceae bacterium]